jgi:hypothetical protein
MPGVSGEGVAANQEVGNHNEAAVVGTKGADVGIDIPSNSGEELAVHPEDGGSHGAY